MSSNAVKPIPDGMHSLTPYLICANAAEAIAFYTKAFNAVEQFRLPGPDGKVMHACLKIGDSMLMLTDEWPEHHVFSPASLKGTPVTVHHYVQDVDASFKQAVEAGATVLLPVTDMFWGDRYGQLQDPFGHRWSLATHIRDLSPEEIQQAMGAAMK
ncbi:VOC family protein [Paraburkholderia sp. BCC1884]|uniref:VOC family protein n=1 Tax=Paraburkholderia sp. BCC1884 TaxID=2562668 RepID=UPI0011827DD8|nr:VOC family protein [Paraburkholderia sp. BCC1884]